MDPTWLDRSPLPAGVLQRARFVYANRALLELVEARWEDLANLPFIDRVAPEDRRRVGDRHDRRVRGEPVTDTYELDILTLSGRRRSVEVWAVGIEDGSVMFQLVDRSGRAGRKEKLAALAQLGVTVQGEPTEDAVFASVGRGLIELGAASVRLAKMGAITRVVAVHAAGSVESRLRDALGGAELIAGVGGPEARRAWDTGSAYLDDLPVAMLRFFGGDHRREARAVAALARAHRLTRGALLRIDIEGKPRELLLVVMNWLLAEDMPACHLFGAQVSAALAAARALRLERGRNAALTAQTRIAAFARGSNELEALFALGASELAGVVGCDAIAIHLVDEASSEARLVHLRGPLGPAREELERVALTGTDLGAVVRGGVPKVFRLPSKTRGAALAAALSAPCASGAVLSIPLATRGRIIGVVSARFATEEISAADVELFEAAGAHFAAAIDAHRLFSDLRKSYAELREAQEKLVQRERLAAIGELAAVVAHEVRNPLGVLFNTFGAFRKLLNEAAGPARTLLEIMEEEALRLNHIVGDLLDFARPIAPTLQRERLDVVVQEAVDAAIVKASRPIAVVRDVEPLPLVPIDARLLRQALLNVAMNAVNAMPEGGTLTLEVRREHARDGARARVSIADTGAGIAPEVASHIFEPFFTTRATGTGLGLAVVKRIVDAHHGEVTFATKEGRGTTFTLWLPLAQVPSSRP